MNDCCRANSGGKTAAYSHDVGDRFKCPSCGETWQVAVKALQSDKHRTWIIYPRIVWRRELEEVQ